MFIFDLNTNGFFPDQEFPDHLKKIGADPMIKISFDGIGYHDWMRGFPGAEEDAVRAIRLCAENGFEVMAQINLNRRNRDSMLRTLELMDELNVKISRIIRTTEVPRAFLIGLKLTGALLRRTGVSYSKKPSVSSLRIALRR